MKINKMMEKNINDTLSSNINGIDMKGMNFNEMLHMDNTTHSFLFQHQRVRIGSQDHFNF